MSLALFTRGRPRTRNRAPIETRSHATLFPGPFAYSKKGGHPALAPLAGTRYLTAGEVALLAANHGGAGLRSAYEALYGVPTKSGNLTWLKAKLKGEQP